jgi:hypothetical protein
MRIGVLRTGGLEVWRTGGLEDWRIGGLEDWGIEDWRIGGLRREIPFFLFDDVFYVQYFA